MLLISRLLSALLCVAALSACELPRGAGLRSEVLGARESRETDFAVYPVTRALLPSIAEWPTVNEARLGWITASRGSSGQIIRTGDMVTVTIWDNDINSLLVPSDGRNTTLTEMRVSPDGSIFLPYVGEIRIGDLSPQAARGRLQSALSEVAPSAQVQLSLTEGRGNSVDLVGGVRQPGSFPMPDNDYTVLSLIAAGGGVETTLENPQIRLQRGDSIYGTSVKRLYSEPNLDTLLANGDQVIVEEDDRYFLSVGAAGDEALHPFPKDTVSAMDSVSIIGGVENARGNPKGILILREYPSSALSSGERGPRLPQVVFTLDLTSADGLFAARNFRIMPKDLIYVTESRVTSAQTVFGIIGSTFGLVSIATR